MKDTEVMKKAIRVLRIDRGKVKASLKEGDIEMYDRFFTKALTESGFLYKMGLISVNQYLRLNDMIFKW